MKLRGGKREEGAKAGSGSGRGRSPPTGRGRGCTLAGMWRRVPSQHPATPSTKRAGKVLPSTPCLLNNNKSKRERWGQRTKHYSQQSERHQQRDRWKYKVNKSDTLYVDCTVLKILHGSNISTKTTSAKDRQKQPNGSKKTLELLPLPPSHFCNCSLNTVCRVNKLFQ